MNCLFLPLYGIQRVINLFTINSLDRHTHSYNMCTGTYRYILYNNIHVHSYCAHVCYCTVCTCMYLYLQSTVQVHTVRIMCVQYLQSTMYSYILHVHMCVQYLQSTMHITQVMCSMYLQLHIGNQKKIFLICHTQTFSVHGQHCVNAHDCCL